MPIPSTTSHGGEFFYGAGSDPYRREDYFAVEAAKVGGTTAGAVY